MTRSNDPSLEAGDDGGGVIEIMDTDDDDSRLNFDDCGKSSSSVVAAASTAAQTEDGIDVIERRPLDDDPPPFPSHTSPAVESALLSSASAPPPPDASADVVLSLVESGKLSPLQAEGATLAISKFHRVYRDGGNGNTRAGERLREREREAMDWSLGRGRVEGGRSVVSCGNVETSCLSRTIQSSPEGPSPSRGLTHPVAHHLLTSLSLSLSLICPVRLSVSSSLSPRFSPHSRFFSQVSSSATAPG